jgi:hypothetical protein
MVYPRVPYTKKTGRLNSVPGFGKEDHAGSVSDGKSFENKDDQYEQA